jgi:predicted PurR-regulated permease PerM
MNSPTHGSGSAPIDTFIRIILLGGLLAWCLLILAPFTSILLWATILAVALQPFHAMLSRWLGGRKGWGAVVLVLIGLVLVALPGYFIGDNLVASTATVRAYLGEHGLHVPQLPADWSQGTGLRRFIADRWPSSDGAFAELVRDNSDRIQAALAWVLAMLASFFGDLAKMLLSIIVMGIMLAYAKAGGEALERFLGRAIGPSGPNMIKLAEKTIRNVAKGILGVALIQASMVALGVFVGGIPGAGLLTVVALLLCIIQIGAGPVAIGVIIYAWAAMDTLPAVLLTIWMLITMVSDNVLKPILLGRGASVPMLVIFLGAIGGFMLSGFIGLFTGAVVLSIGYTLMQEWMGTREGASKA